MALIDIEKLLGEISPDEPCGPDLEYDADCIALMRDAEGKPAKYTPDGQLVEEGEDPNWRDLRGRCVSMFDRTIDLRITMVLVNALMCDQGIGGLREGLALLKALLERHWDHFHPRLDPDDGNDPLERMNILSSFAAPVGAEGDPFRFQQRLREIPLADSRQLGRFGLRDMLVASGDLSPAGSDREATPQLIDGAFQDTDGELLKETGRAAGACRDLSLEIDKWITSKVGAGQACDLSPWHDLLADLCKRLRSRIEQRFPGEAAPAGDGDQAAPGHDGSAVLEARPGGPLTGSIGSREDVVSALNKVLEYYARHEPSSPVPLLIRRAQKLVTMGFTEIIRELSPAALDQVRMIGGEEAMSASPPPSPSPAPAQAAPPRAAEPARPAPSTSSPQQAQRFDPKDFMPR